MIYVKPILNKNGISGLSTARKILIRLKLQKFWRNSRDYNTDNIYTFSSFSRTRPKRVTWAESTYSDIDTTDGDDSTGASVDEGSSSHERPDRAAKGKAKESFFQTRPYRRERQKTEFLICPPSNFLPRFFGSSV